MVTAQAMPSLVPPQASGSSNASIKADSPQRSFFFFVKYRPEQAKLQFSLCQNLGFFVISSTFKCGIVSQKSNFRASKIRKIAFFDLQKLQNSTLRKI